ncbi:unnamed protein product [Schistosoma curassoni]|uniref:Uncharacterized protein n=1 Tax=Schistosoma curassoni TaxID=6186 RepID=A0A183K9A0_9TREM|nr:unnamed protein product [Schistosoma curassoni]
MGLLALACKKNDGGSNDNKSTDGEECVSVVSAATGPVKHLTVVDGNAKSPLTLTRNEVPLDIDIGSHTPLVEIEDPDKTVIVPRSPGVDFSKEKEEWEEKGCRQNAAGQQGIGRDVIRRKILTA